MRELTKAYMDMDPIATAEKLIGTIGSEKDAETALAITFAVNQSKAAHLQSIGDTHFGISWTKFMDIVKAFGFVTGYHQNFINQHHQEEEEVIFFHKEFGLILHAESYNRKTINSGHVYGEIKLPNTLADEQLHALNGFSISGNRNGTMGFDIDVREGLIYYLEPIVKNFNMSNPWTNVPFMWLLNYMDTCTNYNDINKIKIAASSPEVRKIIYG